MRKLLGLCFAAALAASAASASTNIPLVEIIELRQRVLRLEQDVATLQMQLSNRAPANVVEGSEPRIMDVSMIKIESAAAKVMEANDVYWNYAYNLRLKNTSTAPLKIILDVQFYDAQGFTVKEKAEYNLVFAPNETRMISGIDLVGTPAAATVKGVRGRIEYK